MKLHKNDKIDRNRPLLTKSTIFALTIVSLGACAPFSNNIDTTRGWLAASSPKKNEVDQAQYRHVVYFDTDKDEVRAEERDRLLAFMTAVSPSDHDNIRLEGHADERANDVYNIELAARRISAVKGILVEHGIARVGIQASTFGERFPASLGNHEQAWSKNRRVEIVLERFVVTPPACPDWSRRSGLDYSNQPHSNFGCATEANLGLMVANPGDLVRGQKLGPADGVHQAEGIVRYREDDLPELQEEGIE